MLDDLFGETGGAIAQFVLALFVVLILILIVAWLLKKLGGGRFGATNMGQAELEIIDTLAIDPKRRLVLVRHGKLEHLLLIGGGSDEVVERSIVGGLPISARVQATKPAAPAPEKAPEPLARPSSKFLDRLERTNAARKSTAAKAETESVSTPTSVSTTNLASTEDTSAEAKEADVPASTGATTAAVATTVAAGTAYATMMAATNNAQSHSSSSSSPSQTTDTSEPKALESKESGTLSQSKASSLSTADPIPAPIELPPLPVLSKSSTTSAPVEPKSAPIEPKPLPQSEREALEQSLDAALHDSLLTPDETASPQSTAVPETTGAAAATQSTVSVTQVTQSTSTSPPPALPEKTDAATDSGLNTESSTNMDFNLFDDGELEREMEAALADTSVSTAPSPELDAQSTAAIEAELAIDLEEPKPQTETPPSSDQKAPALEADTALPAQGGGISAQPDASDTKDDVPVPETTTDAKSEGAKEAAKENLPPLKDIPVELSRPDTVAVQIPSRGPAANATSLTKADNGIGGEENAPTSETPSSQVDLSQLLEAPETGSASNKDNPAKPATGKSSDLDEEMQRLLGEIAGDPKAN